MALHRTLRRCSWVLLLVLAGTIGFGWRIGAFEQLRITLVGGPPVIEYPSIIDLGERTANELVTERFQIANRGGQELQINQVKASCSCGKLEREIDGRSEQIEELYLAPGQRADMVVNTAIRANAAGTYKQSMSFQTNDPNQPEGQITLVFRAVSGGLRVNPTAVHFGTLLLSQKAREVVDIVDHDHPPQRVTKVVSDDPERVTVRWLPAKAEQRRNEATLLGQVEVVPNTDRLLLLDTVVRIEFANPKIQAPVIQVNGRVRPRVEVTPQSLLLPLSSHSGPVYTGNCLVHLPDDRMWRLEVESVPPGLKVALPDMLKGKAQLVRITWTPPAGDGPGTTKKTVRLRAKSGQESEAIEIPVSCEHQ